jgi:hypothetical protein
MALLLGAIVSGLAEARSRSVGEVLATLGPRLRPDLERRFRAAGVAYPSASITLVAYKQERLLEVWAPAGERWVRVLEFPILAASGDRGPKLREGDYQVPEGEYRLTGLNPASNFHLSIRVDYPSARDRRWADRDGRTELGGDIFIHGNAVSRGCLAIGDQGIEQLFTVVADTGLRNSRILIAPSRELRDAPTGPPWVGELYQDLRRALNGVQGGS